MSGVRVSRVSLMGEEGEYCTEIRKNVIRGQFSAFTFHNPLSTTL